MLVPVSVLSIACGRIQPLKHLRAVATDFGGTTGDMGPAQRLITRTVPNIGKGLFQDLPHIEYFGAQRETTGGHCPINANRGTFPQVGFARRGTTPDDARVTGASPS